MKPASEFLAKYNTILYEHSQKYSELLSNGEHLVIEFAGKEPFSFSDGSLIKSLNNFSGLHFLRIKH